MTYGDQTLFNGLLDLSLPHVLNRPAPFTWSFPHIDAWFSRDLPWRVVRCHRGSLEITGMKQRAAARWVRRRAINQGIYCVTPVPEDLLVRVELELPSRVDITRIKLVIIQRWR